MTYLMNENTGSVDTEQNWMTDFESQGDVHTWGEFSRDLVEVELKGGEWIEI